MALRVASRGGSPTVDTPTARSGPVNGASGARAPPEGTDVEWPIAACGAIVVTRGGDSAGVTSTGPEGSGAATTSGAGASDTSAGAASTDASTTGAGCGSGGGACWAGGAGAGCGAGAGLGAGCGEGAGGGAGAARGGSSVSGSMYPFGSVATRIPRWTYVASCSGVPLGPIDPTTAPSRTTSPLRTAIEPSWTSVTAWPPGVSNVTTFPFVPTVPAKLTTPEAGARTDSSGLPATSIPLCWPPAYGSPP
jgi:hypothetical protein